MPNEAAKNRLPGLDGLRALSVLAVIFLHLYSVGSLPQTAFWSEISQHGGNGVTVFFVLSGFLITWLLLGEESDTGRIHLGAFYARRFLRIVPPALLYLLFVRLLGALNILPVSWSDVFQALFFVRNFFTRGPGETIHYWSLAVEEQFYLLWPLMLLFMPRRLRLSLTTLLVVFAPLWRMEVFADGALPIRQMWRTDIVYDTLLIGCLLALLRKGPRTSRWMNGKILRSPLILIVSVVAFWIAQLPWTTTQVGLSFGASILNIGIAVAINYVVQGRRFPIDWFLNWSPIVWIGQLSYSLYLWQEFFCYKGSGGNFFVRGFPQNVLLTFACAVVSFYCIERPMARLRRRLEARKGQGDG
jgi:peptidoglycan/LPS O-acetylase OafA/YrhL